MFRVQRHGPTDVPRLQTAGLELAPCARNARRAGAPATQA